MTGDPAAEPADGRPDLAHRTELRRAARDARRALTDDQRATLVVGLCQRLLDLLGDPDADRSVLALSVAADGEPDVTAVADELRRRGWVLALPVVGDGTSMTFQVWPEDGPLVANRFGIPEPVGADRVGTGQVEPDVVVVPCVAVDTAGNRLGFGRGFYDRALAEHRPWTVGAVFDEQVVDEVPTGSWDVPLDAVVTPTRTLRPGR